MASKAKKLIPVELLRRSCRTNKQTTTVKHETDTESGRQNPDLKRFKCDDILDDKKSKQRSKIKLEPSEDIKPTNTQEYLTLNPDGTLQIDLEELDLERTLLGGQSFRWTKTDPLKGCDSNYTIFKGVIGCNAVQLWRTDQKTIAFRVLNSESRDFKRVASTLRDYFQLDYKLKDLYPEWSGKDSHFKQCCQHYQGFRILRQDPVENVFSFICATNNNIKRISQMVDKLCKRFGNILENREADTSIYDSYHSFPNVERLAQDDVFDCLRYELGFGYRAKFISETAKKLVTLSVEQNKSPREYLLSLRQLPYKDSCKQLMQFPGIGRKVADCICLMSMDHLNSVPIDCHIYEIVCRNYMPNLREERKTLTDKVHDLIGDYFNNLHGPLAGWATSVLFIGELKHLQKQEK